LTRFNIDPDLGWHLAIGNRFLETGEIIRADQFSWTMPGYVWGNYFFLYEILVAFLFKYLGYILTVVVFGLIGSLAVLILTFGRRLTFWQILVIGLGLSVALTNLAVRPSMISFLFTAVLLFFLDRGFVKKNTYSPLLFGLFVLWANFHQGFVIGVLILGAYLGIDFLWQRVEGKESGLVSRMIPLGVAVLGTLFTPYHLSLWQSIIKDLTGLKTWAIAEWMPTAIYFPANILFALSGLIFIYILVTKFRKAEPVWFLLGAGMFCLAFLVNNLIFVWIAIFIFVTSRYFNFKLNLVGDFWVKIPIVFSASAVFLAFSLNFLVNLADSIGLEKRFILDKYPVEAVNYLKRDGLIKGLFNDYGWGGFIDWQLPEAKVFIDGRMTGWRTGNGRYILADYLAIKRGDCNVAKNYEIKVALLKKDDKPLCFEDWEKVYEDSVAQILRSSSKLSK